MTKLKINTKGLQSIRRRVEINPDRFVTQHNWLSKLAELCSPVTLKQFNEHVGQYSPYRLKEQLKRSLKIHYAVLSGALRNVDPVFNITDDQKAALISKIQEEITACSPGYHARIDSLIESYFIPRTVGELLNQIRYNIVERAANKETGEVHTNNRFFIIAKEMGFGVEPKLPNDFSFGTIPSETIRQCLKKAFDEHFKPFSTLLELKTLIAFGFYEYTGRKENGYTASMYGPALDYFKTLFQEEQVNYDYLICDEVPTVYDINWNLILSKLWTILLKDNYFGYFSLSNTLQTIWMPEFFTNRLKSPTDYAIEVVPSIFTNPRNVEPDKLKLLPHLFGNPKECINYLYCNPDLPELDQVDLLLHTLDHLYSNKVSELANRPMIELLWHFAFDNEKLTDTYIQAYSLRYPAAIKEMAAGFSSNSFNFAEFINNSTIDDLKSLSLKLRLLPNEAIGTILNKSGPSTLYQILLRSEANPKVMRSFIQLTPFIRINELINAFSYRSPNGASILSIALFKKSTGNAEIANQLLATITTFSENNRYHILQLDSTPTDTSPLFLAIKNCPSVVPLMLNMIFSFDNHHRIVSDYLSSPFLQNKQYRCFKGLLELNQRVDALAAQPEKKQAYDAAVLLQTTLIDLLIQYFQKQDNTETITELQNTWRDAINTAKAHLADLSDWKTFFKNLALIIVSIPLLGTPLLVNLAVNYYSYGYKQMLFKPEQPRELDELIQVSNDFMLAM